MTITKLLATNSYIIVNKYLITALGSLESATVMGELAQEYNYWSDKNSLEDGWFYSTVDNIKENTGLSAYQQRKVLQNLEQQDLLKVQYRGIPCKRYIKLNLHKLKEILLAGD